MVKKQKIASPEKHDEFKRVDLKNKKKLQNARKLHRKST